MVVFKQQPVVKMMISKVLNFINDYFKLQNFVILSYQKKITMLQIFNLLISQGIICRAYNCVIFKDSI